MLRVYNTLSRSKEIFEPVTPGKVGIYLCGPTVYKPSHIGHMVGPVIFDAVKRYLVYSGYDVTMVINVTDVDDKLIVESKDRGIKMADLASEMTADYLNNLRAMGVESVDHFPKATENMDEIVKLTKTLVEKGYAYESNGDVYFEVAKCEDYGKLSGRSLENMHGEGGGTANLKRSNADFALWKAAKPDEPSWPSPWGPGRPGWHIECSAMSRRLLGETFDIHCGGLDLIFPHHENEIAQSESCHRKPMAKYWMHNGLMQASDETGKLGGRQTRTIEGNIESQEEGKISKSKGSDAFSDMLKKFQPETIRFFLLSTHYRRPIDFSDERIEQVGTGLETFYRFFKRYKRVAGESFYDLPVPETRTAGNFEPGNDELLQNVAKHRNTFLDSMDDDFNTGSATASLFELVRRLNKFVDDEKLEEISNKANKLSSLRQGAATFRELGVVLGLFVKPQDEKSTGNDALVDNLIKLFIELRSDSRKNKDFATADKIRDSLSKLGITLEDRPGKTEWSIQ